MSLFLASLLVVMPAEAGWRSPLAPRTDVARSAATRSFPISRDEGKAPSLLACHAMSLAIFAATKGREGASCPATPARYDTPQHWERTTK